MYLCGQMVALQGGTGGAVSWVHQDPVTKSQRITDSSGNVVSTVDLDPFGGDTSASSNAAFQPHRYTSYERDTNGADDAMMRRYNRYWGRFDQPDPYDGSYDATNPQSFNRYAYVNNDPVNFVDPSGLLVVPPSIGNFTVDVKISFDSPINSFLWQHMFGSPGGGGGAGGGDVAGGGGGGGETGGAGGQQNTTQDNTRTTCEKFADRVQQLADAATSIKGLLDTLATTFMSQNNGHPTNSSISEMHAAQGGVFVGEARTFSSNNGIRSQYVGNEGGQIRHFVGALIVASYIGGTTAMMLREGMTTTRDAIADRAVNGLASYIHNRVFTRPFPSLTGGRRPASLEQVKKSLADEIRRDLCGP